VSEQKQVMIRASEEDHARWKEAAEKNGLTMSEFIKNAANGAAAETLDCLHPVEFRKTYPWSESCLKCGQRLR
jgi:uncharacterized protein (DUF1778 family)